MRTVWKVILGAVLLLILITVLVTVYYNSPKNYVNTKLYKEYPLLQNNSYRQYAVEGISTPRT